MDTQHLQIAGGRVRATNVNRRQYAGIGPIVILLNGTYEGIGTSVYHKPSGLLSCHDKREVV
jgi:hypothetical protein